MIPNTHLAAFEGLLSTLEIISLRGYRVSFSLVGSEKLHHALSEGHLFFSLACKQEGLVYDDGLVQLPMINSTKLTAIRRKAEREFFVGFEKAAAFLDGTSFFLERHARELAVAPLLHFSLPGMAGVNLDLPRFTRLGSLFVGNRLPAKSLFIGISFGAFGTSAFPY